MGDLIAKVAGGSTAPKQQALGGREDPQWAALFNTKLSPQQEQQFQAYLGASGKTGDLQDYDVRGAWAAAGGDMPLGGMHGTDQYKKPNHPTFSDESQYASPIFPGGSWGSNSYQPTDTAVWTRPELEKYMARYEQGVSLRKPKKRGE